MLVIILTDAQARFRPKASSCTRGKAHFRPALGRSIRHRSDRNMHPILALPHSRCTGATARSEALSTGVMLAVEMIEVGSQRDLMLHGHACW